MKNHLLGIAVFVLAFALSFGYANNDKEKAGEPKTEKASKNCCMDKASGENMEDCADEMKGAEEAGVKVKDGSKKSECSDMWDKMASKDGKMECCKGKKSETSKSTKSTKKSG